MSRKQLLTPRVLAALNAAGDRDRWLAGVLEALGPALDHGLGLVGYWVDVGRDEDICFDMVGPEALRAGFAEWSSAVTDEFKRVLHTAVPFGIGRRLFPIASDEDARRTLAATGFADVLGINGLDATGRGVAIAAPSLETIPAIGAGLAAELTDLAARLAEAALRVGFDASCSFRDGASLPLTTLPDPIARQALRQVVTTAGRTAPKEPPEQARAAWQELQTRRLLLLDRFDHGGRTWYVTSRVAPGLYPAADLSGREAQAVALAADGHSNKSIAWEMGISAATVATLLRRAQVKLNAPGRLAMIRAWRAAQAPPESAANSSGVDDTPSRS